MASINIRDTSDSDEQKAPQKLADMSAEPAPAGQTPTAPEIQETGVVDAEPSNAEDVPVQPEPASGPEDATTDKAVDDIMKTEGDDALKAQDEAAEKAIVMQIGPWEKFKNVLASWWHNPRKRYGALGAIAVVIAVLMAVPMTRYDILGVVFSGQVTVEAVDSKTGAKVSGASVDIGGKTAQTEANGKAVFRVHLGNKNLQVSKKYYQGYTRKELVTFSGGHNTFTATLVATGRRVQVKIVDKVTNKPISNAIIHVQDSQTKTNASGVVTVLIPSGAATQTATVSASSYNTQPIVITANGALVKNTFGVTPAGKLYFLSNLSGKIDVVKTNLDGTSRQTVLAGTGSEDPRSTSLLASRDWKYLALLSKRDGNYASVYLIDTTNGDKLTTIDQGNATFSLVGWSGDRFIYQVTRGDVSDWQSNQQALKSLNADTGQTLLLDQNQASGTSQNDYLKQSFGSPYIVGSQLVYAKNWDASYTNFSQLNGKQAELDSINADGSGHKVVKTFSLDSGAQSSYVGITTKLYEPDGLYISFSTGSQDAFYKYDNGTVSTDTGLNSTSFYQTAYPTFLLSPSGNSTFWTELRDGKNTLFVGDNDAQVPKQVASLSDYSPYGWYSDNYLLVSKNSSELYIMPIAGGTPLKISDYYKPATSYNGYGGGYGGL